MQLHVQYSGNRAAEIKRSPIARSHGSFRTHTHSPASTQLQIVELLGAVLTMVSMMLFRWKRTSALDDPASTVGCVWPSLVPTPVAVLPTSLDATASVLSPSHPAQTRYAFPFYIRVGVCM